MTTQVAQASLFLIAGALLAQELPEFRSDVSLVRVEVAVVDDSRLVTGLSKEDFRLSDQKQPQDIIHFSEDEEPLDIVLLFDVSGSMRGSVRRIAEAADAAFQHLMEGDRVAVMTFAGRTNVIAPLSPDFEAAARAIREEILNGGIRGGTRLFKGADDAARYLMKGRRERRRAVLIVTDNFGQGVGRERSVIRNYWEADASLNAVVVPQGKGMTALNWSVRLTNPHVMLMEQRVNGIVANTGGEMIRSDDPASAFSEMIGRIRRRYCLYYRQPPAQSGEERKVRVELSPGAKQRLPQARVLGKSGYIAP
jgi:Ca-activated chloride channel homolog